MSNKAARAARRAQTRRLPCPDCGRPPKQHHPDCVLHPDNAIERMLKSR